MTTVQRCQKNSLYENTKTDLLQLQSGASPERSFNNGPIQKTNREGNKNQIRQHVLQMLLESISKITSMV